LSVSATLQDGLPRPKDFLDQPTVTYDATPQLTDSNGLPADCIWYGFANEIFNATTTLSCLLVLRLALMNATVNPPSSMKPYVYYTLQRLVDKATNESYCYEGCFDLGNSPAPSPGVVSAPAPLVSAPAPVTAPSSSLSPVPSVASPTPLGSTPLSSPSPAPGLSVPASVPVTSPPAPPFGPVLIPNSGSFLQPTTLFSFFVAFVAVLFNTAA
jgi:hypothetical protein